jgi:hypothetical protein
MVVADKSYEKVREERSVTDPVQIRSSKWEVQRKYKQTSCAQKIRNVKIVCDIGCVMLLSDPNA